MKWHAARLSVLAVVGLTCFAMAVRWLGDHPQKRAPSGLAVVLPPPVQILLSGGDRHFAANAGVARVMAYPADLLRAEDVPVRALIQLHAAAANPAHQDNYYLAAATLEDARMAPPVFRVLERASAARPYDMQPPYFLGALNVLQLGDYASGSRWAGVAAERADSEANRVALERMAGRWAMRAQDPMLGLRMLETMRAQARTRSLRQYLDERIDSVRGLMAVRDAADQYAARFGHPITDLRQLLESGVLKTVPLPAKGYGYALGPNGVPILIRIN